MIGTENEKARMDNLIEKLCSRGDDAYKGDIKAEQAKYLFDKELGLLLEAVRHKDNTGVKKAISRLVYLTIFIMRSSGVSQEDVKNTVRNYQESVLHQTDYFDSEVVKETVLDHGELESRLHYYLWGLLSVS